jgi:hypothetical protein
MTAVERAFHLARSGEFPGITEIIKSLKRDGYSTDQIQGQTLKRQLTTLIRAARLDKEAPKIP